MLLNDISRGALLSVRKHTIGYSTAQAKVIAATANTGTPSVGLVQRFEIAQLSFEGAAYNEITEILTRRLKDKSKWRRVLKALIVLKFCLEEGSEKFEAYCRSNIDLLHSLEQMDYVFVDNRDRGIEVRRAARSILNLLNDHESLGSIRRHTKSVRMLSVNDGVMGQTSRPRKRTLFRSRKPSPPVMVEPFNTDAVPVTAHQRIRRAISNLGSWESALSELQELVSTEWTPDEFMNIVEALLENLVNAQAQRDWMQVFKSLILLRNCLAKASPEMSAHFEGNTEITNLLREFKEMTTITSQLPATTPESPPLADRKDRNDMLAIGNQSRVNLDIDELLRQADVDDWGCYLSTTVEPPPYQTATWDPIIDSTALARSPAIRRADSRPRTHFLPDIKGHPFPPIRSRPLPLPPVQYGGPSAMISADSKFPDIFLSGISMRHSPLKGELASLGLSGLNQQPPLPQPPSSTPSPPYATLDEQDPEPIVNYFQDAGEEMDDDDDLYVNDDEIENPIGYYTDSVVDASPVTLSTVLPGPLLEPVMCHASDPRDSTAPLGHGADTQEALTANTTSYSHGSNMFNFITDSLDTFSQWAWPTPNSYLLENPWIDDTSSTDDVPELDGDISGSSDEEGELDSPGTSTIDLPYHVASTRVYESSIHMGSTISLSSRLDEALHEFSIFIDQVFDLEEDLSPSSAESPIILPPALSPPPSPPPQLRVDIPKSISPSPLSPDSAESGNVSPTRHATLDLTGQVERVGESAHALGGFSDVWRGCLNKDGAPAEVAIKFLRAVKMSDHTSASQRVQLRMRREVDIWERLDHPNVVPLLGYTTESDGTPGLVCPWYSQGNILEHLKKNPFADRKMLVRQVADGLAYLHGQSPAIVHADIKGQNVLVDCDGNAAIADFGLSKLLSECPSSYTTSNSNLGSLRWCSPERLIVEDHKGTLESDLWAFAALALEILTGKVPFYYYENDMCVVRALVSGEIPSRERYPELPPDNKFWDILESCWRMDPAKRPSMAELRPLIFDDETFATCESMINV